ncbi:MAG: crossover junction endodeoxyribonuclease RuvC [Anaplasmataceae bacterium]|nr:crossover junction endodeoxyribonuclease RuvC [Anaplasmataceae bacterium]
MIILGIDPGTHRLGYGLIEKTGSTLRFLEAGLINIATEPPQSFEEAKKGLEKIIATYKPQRVGLEKLFFAKNQKTAMAVSEMRGVLRLTIIENQLELYEFNPKEIKLCVCGDGQADKKGVAKMMKLILNLHHHSFIDDAWDGLAIAYTTSCQPDYLKKI